MIDLKEIRELAAKYSPDQIESCITQQIETGQNVCLADSDSVRIVNELAKASFIRKRMEDGMPLPDALRELAKKMREFMELARNE